MQQHGVAVGILYFEVPATAMILRRSGEAGTAGLQLRVGGMNVVHGEGKAGAGVQLGRRGAALERQRDVAAVELGPLVLAAVDLLREAEYFTVETRRGSQIGYREHDEVSAADFHGFAEGWTDRLG